MKKSQWKALRHPSLRSLQNNKQLLMSLLPLLRKCKSEDKPMEGNNEEKPMEGVEASQPKVTPE